MTTTEAPTRPIAPEPPPARAERQSGHPGPETLERLGLVASRRRRPRPERDAPGDVPGNASRAPGRSPSGAGGDL